MNLTQAKGAFKYCTVAPDLPPIAKRRLRNELMPVPDFKAVTAGIGLPLLELLGYGNILERHMDALGLIDLPL